MGSWGLRDTRCARRLLAQQPEDPPCRVPQQELHRQPKLLLRFPGGPDAHPLNLFPFTSYGILREACILGHIFLHKLSIRKGPLLESDNILDQDCVIQADRAAQLARLWRCILVFSYGCSL